MQVPRAVQLGGLVALALADVALVVAITRSTNEVPAAGPRTPSTSASSPTTTPTTSPTTTAARAVAGVRAMAVVDEKVAYRAAAAGCSVTSPGLERSTDGGRTWRPVTIEGPRSVVRIEFTSATEGYVVGTTSGCELRVWRTSTGGTDWTDPGPASDYWSALPSSTTKVNSVGGTPRTPCPAGSVTQLARVTDADAYVLCSTGVLRRTGDRGQTWTTTATVPGARAVAADKGTDLRIVLAGTDPDCQGTRVWSIGPTTTSVQAPGCVPTGKQAAPIALDAGGSSVWLSVGSSTLRSSGDLRSWSGG